MQQVNTLDTTLVLGDAVDRNAGIAVGGLRGGLLKFWKHTRQAVRSQIVRSSRTNPLSGYYAGAYNRADASTPVTTFRAFALTNENQRQ